MNDFPHNDDNSCGLLYADDSLLYSHNESPLIALNYVKQHLTKVKNFYETWGIKINISKSEAICIRNASGKCRSFVVPESKRLKLNIDGTEIPFKNCFKYLGIEFDKLMKFNKHARSVMGKAYRILNIFSRILLNKNLPINTKLLLYKTSIRPILLYGFPIWFSISPIIVKEMGILERKVLRHCVGKYFEAENKRYSNNVIYREARITPIGLYVCDILNRFISRLRDHPNQMIRDIYNRQHHYSWTNTNYLSPIGFVNENPPNFDTNVNICYNFYSKSTAGTHRG